MSDRFLIALCITVGALAAAAPVMPQSSIK
jgi:hypothetical protein